MGKQAAFSGPVMYGRTYTRRRRARDIRHAAERAQRVTDAAQGLAKPSSG